MDWICLARLIHTRIHALLIEVVPVEAIPERSSSFECSTQLVYPTFQPTIECGFSCMTLDKLGQPFWLKYLPLLFFGRIWIWLEAQRAVPLSAIKQS